ASLGSHVRYTLIAWILSAAPIAFRPDQLEGRAQGDRPGGGAGGRGVPSRNRGFCGRSRRTGPISWPDRAATTLDAGACSGRAPPGPPPRHPAAAAYTEARARRRSAVGQGIEAAELLAAIEIEDHLRSPAASHRDRAERADAGEVLAEVVLHLRRARLGGDEDAVAAEPP